MRLDKFLKISFLLKRREVANEAIAEGFIFVNGKKVKPAFNIKKDDIIELDMWNFYKKVKVLEVPEKGNISKKDIDKFIEVLEYRTKDIKDIL
jgi:ribosomal 50S subunit-recycling heat shock protein